MAINRIDTDLCTSCGLCVKSCPADVLRMNMETKKAVVAYQEECVVCGWCVAVCRFDAVKLSTETLTIPLFTSWG